MDTMPKRRRSTDNPYILSKDEKNNIYLVSFVDGTNTYRTVKITREIYEAMDSFERHDLNELKVAINQLQEIQQRRIIKYYFEDKSQQKIANEENVDIRSIQYSLNIAIKNLKKFLNKTS